MSDKITRSNQETLATTSQAGNADSSAASELAQQPAPCSESNDDGPDAEVQRNQQAGCRYDQDPYSLVEV
jgi:hypothetical protein